MSFSYYSISIYVRRVRTSHNFTCERNGRQHKTFYRLKNLIKTFMRSIKLSYIYFFKCKDLGKIRFTYYDNPALK